MFHHDHRDYAVAASQAAAKGREKMQQIIDTGKANAGLVIQKILDTTLTDKVAPTERIQMMVSGDGGFSLHVPQTLGGMSGDTGAEYGLHPHAFDQVITHAGVPKKFYEHVIDEAGGYIWGKDLIARNVNEILAHRKNERRLLRIEDEKVKGFLSDKFRRLDSRPLVDAFVGACNELQMLPIDGIATDTKVRVRAVLPMVFEPVDNEVMIFGAEFGNSDFGDGGLVMNLWTMRVWCTNLAIAEKCLRQVHLGSRLPDDIQFSDETYRRDTRAMVSAVKDVTANIIAPNRVNRMLEAIKTADAKEIQGRDGIDKILARAGLQKNELDRVKTVFESNDTVNLPPGNSTWRLSNALTWVAQSKDIDSDRKLELQQVAGQLAFPDTGKNAVAV